jgi:hypothetical protein
MDKLPVDLQPDERVVMRVRRTPVYFVAKLVAIALALALPIAALLWVVNATAGLTGTARTVTLIVCAVWALGWLVRAYFTWYQHVHDEWLVTSQRLVDSRKKNLFNQEIASADLVNVQDINVSKKGLLASIFDFGDVVCQTAGTDARFVLSDVPKPAEVMRVIDGTRDVARGSVYDVRRPPRGYVEAPTEDLSDRPRPQFVPRAAPLDHTGGPPSPPPPQAP